MNTDEQALCQRLREEFGALEISPAPVLRVTGRGREVRARRRALAAGTAILAALAVVAAAHLNGRAAPAVTLNQPNPAAPGGVFASGVTNGKSWRLAVRNVADPGTRSCLAAVMLNGQYGGILGIAGPRPFPIVDGGVLTDPPGWPRAGFGFEAWSATATRLAYRLPSGQLLDQPPVAVTACGRRFLMSGYSFTRAGTLDFTAYTRHGPSSGHFPLPDPARPWPPGSQPGIWSVGASVPGIGGAIGSGTVGSEIWHIRTSLGLAGQCYTATLRDTTTLRGNRGRGQGSACVPVSAPPRTIDLVSVPVQSPRTDLPGYAGLVSPHTAYVIASVDNGTTERVAAVHVAGRAYIALVVPAGCTVTELGLFDAYGHVFATSNGVPAGGQPIPGLPQPHGTAGSS